MQELIDELHEAAEDVPVPLELPEYDHMVVAMEQILMPLHDDFKEYLLEASDVVFGTMEPVTVADPSSHTYLPEVTAYAWSIRMPRDMVALCEYRGGYYCVSLEGEVKYWVDGRYDDDQTFENIWYWVRDAWLES